MELKHPEDYYIKLLLNKVKIEEIMTRNVISLKETDRFSLVEEKFREFRIRHLPIVNKENKLVGILTQRDLYRIQAPRLLEDGSWFYDQKSLDSHILKHVMTQNPTALKPHDTAASAVLLMAERKYGCLPVVQPDGSLCGIITQYDILKIAAQILKE